MICDYSSYKAKRFIQYITSDDIYRCFDSAEQSLRNIESKAEAVIREANYLLQRAESRQITCCKQIKDFSKELNGLKSNLKNTSPVRTVPKIGLDGKPATDKYGNAQQIFFNNADYEQAKAAMAACTIKLEEANRDIEWTKDVIDKANELISKYGTLKKNASDALQRFDCVRSDLKYKLEKIADLAKKAMNAAEAALEVNMHRQTIVRYQCIPLLRKE